MFLFFLLFLFYYGRNRYFEKVAGCAVQVQTLAPDSLILIPALSLASCVTLSKFPTFLRPHFLIVEWGC